MLKNPVMKASRFFGSSFSTLLTASLTIGCLATTTAAFADGTGDQDYFTIKSVRFQRLAPEAGPAIRSTVGSELRPLIGPPDSILGEIGDIINVGKQLWPIIEANHPVVNVTTDVANAIPASARSPSDLEKWQGNRNATYGTVFENMLGMDVVSLKYQVTFEYGGQYQQHGKYIANATVVPQSITVAWGYHFNASVKTLQPGNIGTREEPVASLPLLFNWKITTPVVEKDGTTHFGLQGDGQLRDLNN